MTETLAAPAGEEPQWPGIALAISLSILVHLLVLWALQSMESDAALPATRDPVIVELVTKPTLKEKPNPLPQPAPKEQAAPETTRPQEPVVHERAEVRVEPVAYEEDATIEHIPDSRTIMESISRYAGVDENPEELHQSIWKEGKIFDQGRGGPIAEAIGRIFPGAVEKRTYRDADGGFFSVVKRADGSYKCIWGEPKNPFRELEIILPIVKDC